MAENTNPLVRGCIEIEDLCFGSGPPTVALRRIHELTETRLKIDVYVGYQGDGSVKLRGLDINLDGCANVEFFCPFEMTLCDVRVEDTLTVEVVRIGGTPETSSTPEIPAAPIKPHHPHHRSPAPLWGPHHGARLLRPISTPGIAMALASAMAPAPSQQTAPVAPLPPPHPPAAGVGKQQITIRLWDNPLKEFRVKSNFSTISGAEKKVEATLRSILNPAMESMKLHGIKFEI